MPTLSLLRHAKSSWDRPELTDFERPLAGRGRKAAVRMGAFMATRGIRPDIVLCSPAARARATLELVLAQLGGEPPHVVYEEDLYLAEPGRLLALLWRLGESTPHAMIVGHDPGLHALARRLAGAGDRRDIGRLARKFPTAALAVLDFEGGWGEVAAGAGRLVLFVTPRSLA